MVDLPEYWDTFDKRLDYVLKARGLTNREFALRIDAERGQQIVHNWRKRGRIGWPNHAKVREILGSPDIDWLNDGRGEWPMKPDELLAYQADQRAAVKEKSQEYPLQPATDKASHSVGIDPAKLRTAIRFLDQQCALWGRDVPEERYPLLLAGIYDQLDASDPSNLVTLSQWLADQMGPEGRHVGQAETGSAGSDDRARARGGT